MANKTKTYGKNNRKQEQLTIFDMIKNKQASQEEEHKGGTFDIDKKIREALKDAMTGSGKKARAVAYEMSELLGCEITESKLSSYITKDGYYFPAKYLGAFCEVTGSNWPIKVITKQVGLFVMESPDAIRTERDKITSQIKRLQSKKRKHDILLEQLEGK